MAHRWLLLSVCVVCASVTLPAQRPTMVLAFYSTTDLGRVVAALSVRHGYSATLENGKPNPQTPTEFVRRYLAGVAIAETLEHELATARSTVTVAPVVID